MTCTDYLTHPNKSHIASQQRSHHSERANPPLPGQGLSTCLRGRYRSRPVTGAPPRGKRARSPGTADQRGGAEDAPRRTAAARADARTPTKTDSSQPEGPATDPVTSPGTPRPPPSQQPPSPRRRRIPGLGQPPALIASPPELSPPQEEGARGPRGDPRAQRRRLPPRRRPALTALPPPPHPPPPSPPKAPPIAPPQLAFPPLKSNLEVGVRFEAREGCCAASAVIRLLAEVFAAAPAVQDAMVAGGDLSQIVAAGLAANLSRATQTLVVPPPATTLLLGGAAPHPGGWCARELWARLTMPLIGSGMVPNIPQVDMGPIWPVSSLLRDQGPPSPLLAVQPAQGEADSLVMGGLDIASVRYAALGGLIHLGAPSGGHEVAFVARPSSSGPPQLGLLDGAAAVSALDRGWLARATVVLLLPRVLLEACPLARGLCGDPASPPSTQPSSSPPTSEAPAQEPKTQVRTPPRTGPDMIWVGGLPSSCAHPDLVAGLAKSSLHVLAARRPRGARGPRPYAFVQLASHDEAVRAVQLGTIDICGARVVLRKIRMGRQQQATAHRAVAPACPPAPSQRVALPAAPAPPAPTGPPSGI
ncbi:hypothetical protein PAPYR_8961 [Paratrimastix pyriformis]|uniref:RRM domain-containing protein n=1 Tax=Paratrimastix pyriformis TaxID=342808 RepID=A0ABQ8U9K6_9EUKA|nr:hypothetical protein PAPYR_8961 [Paratrimastix pyriformis]